MIRKLLIATLLLCAVALAQPPQGAPGDARMIQDSAAASQISGRGRGEMHQLLPPGRWWKNAEVAKTIGLNDGQVQKIEQIFQDSRMKLVDIHANLQKEEIKLEPLLEADNPDESAVLGAIDRIAAARAALEKANAQMAFAIRRVLTPEQWKNLRSLRPRQGHHFPPPEGGPRGNFKHRRHPRSAAEDAPAPPSGAATPHPHHRSSQVVQSQPQSRKVRIEHAHLASFPAKRPAKVSSARALLLACSARCIYYPVCIRRAEAGADFALSGAA